MKLAYGDDRTSAFVTNVGLISSHGPYGYNVMACEWTHQISNDPGLIALAIRDFKATYHNILACKEFGVGIAAFDQNSLSSIVGNTTAKKVDTIRILEELGYKLHKAHEIDVMMLDGTCMNAECRLVKHIDIGDHPLLIGEVLRIEHTDKEPLLYKQGKYYRLGEQLHKPSEDILQHMADVIKKHTKS